MDEEAAACRVDPASYGVAPLSGVTVIMGRDGVFGWSCHCGSPSLSLLRGSTADFTIRCGCGKVYRAQLEEVTGGS